MTAEQEELLRKAKKSLEAAQLLLEGGFPAYAGSRAYYSMFYVAQAFLEGDGLVFSNHSAVIAGFGKHFANTGRVPVEYHSFLIEGLDIRHEVDYATPPGVSESQASIQIGRAKKFLDLATSIIGPLPGQSEEKAE